MDLTVIELKQICKKKGLKKYSKLNKKNLIKLIKQNGGFKLLKQTPKRVLKKLKKDIKKSYHNVKLVVKEMNVNDFIKENNLINYPKNIIISILYKGNYYLIPIKEYLKLKVNRMISFIEMDKKENIMIITK